MASMHKAQEQGPCLSACMLVASAKVLFSPCSSYSQACLECPALEDRLVMDPVLMCAG